MFGFASVTEIETRENAVLKKEQSLSDREQRLTKLENDLRHLQATLQEWQQELVAQTENIKARQARLAGLEKKMQRDFNDQIAMVERLAKNAEAEARLSVFQEVEELRDTCEHAKNSSANSQAAFRRIKRKLEKTHRQKSS